MNHDEARELVSNLDVSDKLKASMMRTFDALQDRWDKDRDAAATAYQIDIPAQSIRICGELKARHAPPVRIVHGCEYVTFERGNDDSESDH